MITARSRFLDSRLLKFFLACIPAPAMSVSVDDRVAVGVHGAGRVAAATAQRAAAAASRLGTVARYAVGRIWQLQSDADSGRC